MLPCYVWFLGSTLPSSLTTFKLVGDNIDKHVKPRDMRFDYQARDLCTLLPCAWRLWLQRSLQFSRQPWHLNYICKLPKMRRQFVSIFLSWLLALWRSTCHSPQTSFGTGLEGHIQHQYHDKTSKKSEVVSETINVILYSFCMFSPRCISDC
jgi:hypothetical protein